MAFSNYADLVSGVESWIDREEDDDVVARIPDFIVFGENRIFRTLRSRFNEEEEIYTTNTSQGITLPDDFKEVKLLLWDGRALVRKSDQWFYQKDPTTQAQETPKYYARTLNNQIEFWGPPDNDAEVRLLYYNQQRRIDDNFTPALYTQYPELYLFGALLEALPFLENTADAAMWAARYQEVFDSLQSDSDDAEYAGSTVEVSSPYPDGEPRNNAQRGLY